MSIILDGTNGLTLNNSQTIATSEGKLTIQTTAGTSTAYTITPTIAWPSYSLYDALPIQFHLSPGTSPTLNVSGLGAKNLKYVDTTGTKQFVTPFQVPINWVSWVIYDGTDLVVLNVNGTRSSGGTQKAIFGYGWINGAEYSMTNLVSNQGVVATDTTGVGTVRSYTAAAGYGGDKAIFGYGSTGGATTDISVTNKVSNLGVVATDTTGVGTARNGLAAAGYGTDKAIFAWGYQSIAPSYPDVNVFNLVSNQGVVATDQTPLGTARDNLAAAGYGTDKAIFGYGGYGNPYVYISLTNTVSNQGVMSSDITGVGTARVGLAAAGYGTDKAIFGYGWNGTSNLSMTNKVSNQGVVATDTTGVGTAREGIAAAGYGTDKAIFGYGFLGGTVTYYSLTNLVSNQGVVSANVTGVGTAREGPGAAGFSLTT